MAQRTEKVTLDLDATEFTEDIARASEAVRELRNQLDLLAERLGSERPSRLRRICDPEVD